MQTEHSESEAFFDMLRETEYSRLDQTGQLYLDYTGGNIYPQSLLDSHHIFLKNGIYGNPHSNNAASQLSGKCISETREAILKFFNAENYHCVFTNNASGALQIVGECYPFSTNTHLILTADNHNSVNGIREYCKNKGGHYSYCLMNQHDLTIDEVCLTSQLEGYSDKKNKLFAFPAQSNASGAKHSLSWIKKAKDKGWDVLLDAAAFVPASKLDLTEVDPDFVCLSFYKMFGYPTGLGCLLIKKSTFSKLKKPWFAGGTVSLVAVNSDNHFLTDDVDRFENGTVNYLDIPAIGIGLNFMNTIGIENISSRIQYLSELFIRKLKNLRHDSGLPLIKIYGPEDTEQRGGTILMNFLDRKGEQYPYKAVEKIANEGLISFRTGCFCNPGIDEIISEIGAEELSNYFACRRNADYEDMVGFFGRLRGAIRVSIGIPTTTRDILRFIAFAEMFLNTEIPLETKNPGNPNTMIQLSSISSPQGDLCSKSSILCSY